MCILWGIQITCSFLAFKLINKIIERFRPIMDSWPVVLITLYTYISSAYVNFMSDRYFVHIAPLVILFLVTQGVFLIILFNFELSRHDELNRQKMQQSEINSLMEYTEKLEELFSQHEICMLFRQRAKRIVAELKKCATPISFFEDLIYYANMSTLIMNQAIAEGLAYQSEHERKGPRKQDGSCICTHMNAKGWFAK